MANSVEVDMVTVWSEHVVDGDVEYHATICGLEVHAYPPTWKLRNAPPGFERWTDKRFYCMIYHDGGDLSYDADTLEDAESAARRFIIALPDIFGASA